MASMLHKESSLCFLDENTGGLERRINFRAEIFDFCFDREGNNVVLAMGSPRDELVLVDLMSLKEVCVLDGHQKRVLWLAQSPDGQDIVTGAADEFLKFWRVFPSGEERK